MNNDQNKNHPLKKVKEGSVEYRDNEHKDIIKGAKQEDQLDKLNKGHKAEKDDVGSRPVKHVRTDRNDPDAG